MIRNQSRQYLRSKNNRHFSLLTLLVCGLGIQNLQAAEGLPIADAHVHYSHDSVELTPPERVIGIMRDANLKFALVSSSDDKGTQLLSNLAPDLIVPGLRPYTRRGQLSSWYTDKKNLDYVEGLLQKNRYATIGEFHLYGEAADLEIPRRIVELAVEHNLILHAHSDADAVERLLSHNNRVKVLWAHAGFDEPEFVSEMLSKHDRLWVDLAFRGEVGSGGSLSREWRDLIDTHPTKIMLGTDTYTPERIHYIPDNASSARVWLETLPADLAEKIAWRNAYDLIMPVWHANRSASRSNDTMLAVCKNAIDGGGVPVLRQPLTVIKPLGPMKVNEPFDVTITVCGPDALSTKVTLDATMPAHGHGMNYLPKHKVLENSDTVKKISVKGVRLHMPGVWQWKVNLRREDGRKIALHQFKL